MVVKPIAAIKKRNQTTIKKIMILCLSTLISLITATAMVKCHYADDNSMFDSVTGFHDNLFSDQYTGKPSGDQETENDDALLDAVGEKLTIHAVAEK
ncbi:hypothetical protein [Vibrio salinus]|uniref:hypothetical protein n=1 Tax=Vibrio salinus TaxID=2899784 RepID=UPI001E5E1320|nr:hypothetical protein [Vibrio salinus]MCE0494845.1 hypothetical protein [Vibrio salinus]